MEPGSKGNGNTLSWHQLPENETKNEKDSPRSSRTFMPFQSSSFSTSDKIMWLHLWDTNYLTRTPQNVVSISELLTIILQEHLKTVVSL